jgi:hypothetical protein
MVQMVDDYKHEALSSVLSTTQKNKTITKSLKRKKTINEKLDIVNEEDRNKKETVFQKTSCL